MSLRQAALAAGGALALAGSLLGGTAMTASAAPVAPVAQAATTDAAPATRATVTAVPPASRGPVVTTAKTRGHEAGALVGDGLRVQASPCWYSSSHWWCNNVSGAGVYINEGGEAKLVGRMYSNPSWFTCRSDNGGYIGGPHPYRWEWTQADNGAWGWMKDTDIYSETDPLPVC
ncbi:hypothetical protein ACIQ6Y_20470 [Streptomyces sp. NPDC096205]|uniref:hypothetical protein n=1 Tax=Streptomyces sp. NPDC096205 TaxID=3366081 RepID=UPI003805E79E